MQDTTFLLTASTEICEDTFRQKKKSMDNKHGGNWGQIFADAPNVNIDTIRTELEGPTPLRVMAALGGLATTAAASLGLVNLPALFLSPARYLLQCYMAIFGLLVVLIEMKSLGPGRSDRYKAFIYRWLPFTSVVGGKGISYIFLGSLGLSFGMMNVLLFFPGVFLVGMGLIYCAIHLGKCKSLEERYAQSVYFNQQHS